MKMNKFAQIVSLLIASATAMTSTTAFAEPDNCNSYWPKVPYSCELAKVSVYPAERADFSAFETGAVKTTENSVNNVDYVLRSVSRDTARKLRSQPTGKF